MAINTVNLPVDPHAHAKDAHGGEPVRPLMSFYVYEAPVRLWHWVTFLVITVLCLTGYFIASPPQSSMGDTSTLFDFGQLREWHFIAGWLLAIGTLWRAYWAIVGGPHARLIYFVPFWKLSWWKECVQVVKWYLFMSKGEKWIGHNPLARAAMFGVFTLGSFFMVLSGFALYAEGKGMDSIFYKLFGWMISLAGSSMTLRLWHHVGMYMLLLFVAVHVYAAIRDDIMGRVSTISSMVSGWRTFRDFKE